MQISGSYQAIFTSLFISQELCNSHLRFLKWEQPAASLTDIKDVIAAEMMSFKTDILESIIAASPKQDKKTFAQKLKELFQ